MQVRMGQDGLGKFFAVLVSVKITGDAVRDDLRNAIDAGRDDWLPERHCLKDRERKTLSMRAQDEDIQC